MVLPSNHAEKTYPICKHFLIHLIFYFIVIRGCFRLKMSLDFYGVFM